MEPEIQDFLKRVVWSISFVLLYMIINSTAGIAAGWLFFYDRPTPGNYIFYAWLLISIIGLLWLLIKWWKKKFPHG
jgi:hypothetical protein